MTHEERISLGIKRTTWHATVVPACCNCGAQGFYMSDKAIRKEWPKCYMPHLLPGEKLPVGNRCPQCLSTRPDPIEQGQISTSLPAWAWQTAKLLKRAYIGLLKLTGALPWK